MAVTSYDKGSVGGVGGMTAEEQQRLAAVEQDVNAKQSQADALDQISELMPAVSDLLQFKEIAPTVFEWVNRSILQLKSDLGIGTTADKIGNICQVYMLGNLISIPTYLSSFGEAWFLQNNLSQHTMRLIQAVGWGQATATSLGLPAMQIAGSTTGINNTQGTEWSQLSKLAVIATGFNNLIGIYFGSGLYYYPAATQNFGHIVSIGFGVSDNLGSALVANARMFVGDATSISAPTDVAPQSLTNVIGVIQSPTLPNPNRLYFMINGTAATGYTVDTGIDVSISTGWRLTIFNVKGSRKLLMRISDINTDFAFNHEIDLTTLPANQQPSAAAAYSPRLWRSSGNAGTQTPTRLALSKIYLEGKN